MLTRLAAGVFAAVLLPAMPANATATPVPAAAPTLSAVPRRCEAALPIAGAPTPWRHLRNRLLTFGQAEHHRGHDVFVRQGDAQWAVAKLAYGIPDRSLADEDVDVFLLRDCARWERLGSTRTSGFGTAAAMPDGSTSREAGIASFRIPDAQRLAVGMHRVRFVTRGDHTAADVTIDVIAPGTPVAVSDMDGTLTEYELANLWWVVGLRHGPLANAGAPEALRALADRGYRIFYLTGRPDWVANHILHWLQAHGFPPGVLRTRAGAGIGIFGPDVQRYKETEMRALTSVLGRPADYAFGNTTTDVCAYRVGGVDPQRCFFYRMDGDRAGGHLNTDYRALAATFRQLPVARPRPSAEH